jgi:hypothetical protein
VKEIFDIWRCSNRRTIAEEACEPFSDHYKKEFNEQVPDLFADLASVGFRSRPLTLFDFFIRMVSFSYLDEKGKHRSGAIKICLRVPVESSFELNGKRVFSLASYKTSLHSCEELLQSLLD